MKKTIARILMMFLFPIMALAGATLQWDAPEGQVDGYIIYYNEWSQDVGSVTEFDVAGLNLQPGVDYAITVTAYNDAGESEKSNAVSYTQAAFVPDEKPCPVVIRIPNKITSIRIEMAD